MYVSLSLERNREQRIEDLVQLKENLSWEGFFFGGGRVGMEGQERNKLATGHLEHLGIFLNLILISVGFSLSQNLLLPLTGFLPRSR